MDRKFFSRLKQSVAKDILRRNSFTKGYKSVYWRAAPGGITGIEVQTSEFRPVFYINIAWTLAGAAALTTGTTLPPEDMCIVDFLLYDRLRQVSKQEPELPESFNFEGDEAEVRSKLDKALGLATKACDSVAAWFAEPARLLDALPPDLLKRNLEAQLMRSREGASKPNPYIPTIASALHGFFPGSFNLSYFLALVSVSKNHKDLAGEYLQIASMGTTLPRRRKMIEDLTCLTT